MASAMEYRQGEIRKRAGQQVCPSGTQRGFCTQLYVVGGAGYTKHTFSSRSAVRVPELIAGPIETRPLSDAHM